MKDKRVIMLQYKKQETLIEVRLLLYYVHNTTAKIRRGVRQGSYLSPYVFNIFLEE